VEEIRDDGPFRGRQSVCEMEVKRFVVNCDVRVVGF